MSVTTIADLFASAEPKLKSLSRKDRDDLFGSAYDIFDSNKALGDSAGADDILGVLGMIDNVAGNLGLQSNLVEEFAEEESPDALYGALDSRVPQDDLAKLEAQQARLNGPSPVKVATKQPSPVKVATKQPSPVKPVPARVAPGTRSAAPAAAPAAREVTRAAPRAAAPAPAAPTKVGRAGGIARNVASVATATVVRGRNSGDKKKAHEVILPSNRSVEDEEVKFWYSLEPGTAKTAELDLADKNADEPLDSVTRNAIIAKARKADLYAHYHHDKKTINSLFTRNRQVIKSINDALKKFYLCFGRYSDDVTLHLTRVNEKSNVLPEYLKVNIHTVKHLEAMRDARLDVERYWFEAKHAKDTEKVATGGGQLQKAPVILTDAAKAWFAAEPLAALEGRTAKIGDRSFNNLKDYLVAATGAKDYSSTLLGRGYAERKSVTSLVRLASGGSVTRTPEEIESFKTEGGRARAKYAWSAAAKKALSQRAEIVAGVGDKGKAIHMVQPAEDNKSVLEAIQEGTTKYDKDNKALLGHSTSQFFWGTNVTSIPSFIAYSDKTVDADTELSAEDLKFLKGESFADQLARETEAISKFGNGISVEKSRQEAAAKKIKSY